MVSPEQRSSGEVHVPWIAATSIPERSRGAEGLAVGADFVLLDAQGQVLRGLNATGAAVWELIDGRRPLVEIAGEVARRYAEPEPRVLEDVLAFARVLAEKGLIRIPRVAP